MHSFTPNQLASPLMTIELPPGKALYFLSDFHLGVPDHAGSLQREKNIVAFLEKARQNAAHIFILGDMFDFWYEYKNVVPRGYTRLLGKLAELTDSGIPVSFFVGNHDMWMSGYFEEELNIPVYHEPQSLLVNNTKLLIGHGDGLGPEDYGYKFIKKVFRNRFCQWLFGALHPRMGIGLANYFSKKSRQSTQQEEQQFLGEDKEWLVHYCRSVLEKEFYDFFIFGHRHIVLDFKLTEQSRYINLGDWIRYNSYATFDGKNMVLQTYTP
jgi:UDP-2,3-diacylglucosamine hydrolase